MISDKTVFLDVDAADKVSAFQKIASFAQEAGAVPDKEAYFAALMKREDEMATNMGGGIAIPHGVVSGITDSSIIYVKFRNPIDWSEDEEKVKIAIALVVPESKDGNAHLKVLSNLARKLMHEDFAEKLKASNDVNEIAEMLRGEYVES